MEIKNAEFLASFASYDINLEPALPEIALIGKSNVGKSSLINYITNNYKLAKTSGQPGKTRLINYFILNRSFYLVDLPGYGYAKVSKGEKEKWGELIEGYLKNSSGLIHLLHLVDIRHNPTEDDRLMNEWIRFYRVPFTIIATKCDKLSKSQIHLHVQNIRERLKLSKDSIIIPFSVPGRMGRELLLDRIEKVLEQNQEEPLS